MADASHTHLPTVCFLATFQFRDETRRVARYDEFTSALVPWERVIGVVGGDTFTLEVAMPIISGGVVVVGGGGRGR